ncbi:MAG: chemotaxis protein CheW [Lachnospiraceae bacterium]|nr:chemotaxis protein CheW [Lachnospiraceae bacterium]
MVDEKTVAETVQYVVIQIGSEQYGIDIKYVDNIVRVQRATRVPKVPEYIRGVINLRGEVIPIMNVRLKMNLDDVEDTKNTRIIIVKLEQQGMVGLIVDEVKEVLTVSLEDVDKVSYEKDEKSHFLSGIAKYDNRLISILDLNAVVSEEKDPAKEK